MKRDTRISKKPLNSVDFIILAKYNTKEFWMILRNI